MKQEKKFLHRMVWSYTLVFAFIFLLVIGSLYVILVVNSREQARLNNQMLVGQPLKQLDRFLKEMDDVASKAMTSEILIRKFSDLRDNGTPGNHYDTDVLDNIDTASVLAGINGRLMPVRRVIVYNDRGDFISSGAIIDRQLAGHVLAQRDVTGLMDRFRTAGQDYLVSHPEKDQWMSFFKDDYFTFTRPIMNVYSRDVVGIVEVQRNRELLEEYLRFSPDRPLSINIYDETGAPVILGGGADDVVVASATSEDYLWTVEMLEPKSVMRGEYLRLLWMMALTWLLLSGAVVIVIRIIASRISRPLLDLTAAVRGISAVDPEDIHVSGVKIDEIVALEAAFNQMLRSLTLSMDQEKKSFLLAMQAQMNPHFLYNVLSVINAVALEGKSDMVVKICGDLSAMLRYSSSYVQGSATVREELGHTTAYLNLMKSRYDYMFAYSVHLDEALAEIHIPKLVIQPLCENCFNHAFANREPPYRIAIRVTGTADCWRIEVSDNGSGFPADSRQRMLERANNASYEDLSQMQIGGLGLVSSVVRLKLFTAKAVWCDIQDASPSGSTVIINIPGSGAAGRPGQMPDKPKAAHPHSAKGQ